MRKPTGSPKNVQAKSTRKPAANWMQLEIAPLIAQRMYCGKPLPGTDR